MTEIFSYNFLGLWAIALVLYYTLFKRYQWVLLLVMSLVFYADSLTKAPLVLVFVSAATYLGARMTASESISKKLSLKYISALRKVIVIACVAVLAIGKSTTWFALLGNSYFTLKAIGYMIDANKDDNNYEKNFLFYLLYLIYLPTILQGPFNRFAQFKENFTDRPVKNFNYTEFAHGVQRFLWGG